MTKLFLPSAKSLFNHSFHRLTHQARALLGNVINHLILSHDGEQSAGSVVAINMISPHLVVDGTKLRQDCDVKVFPFPHVTNEFGEDERLIGESLISFKFAE